MKNTFILLFLLLGTSCYTQAPQLKEVRALYKRAVAEEKSCKQMVTLLQSQDEKTSPVLAGYKASATMIMAKYVFNPFTKLTHFQKGKIILERAIEADRNNAELRFLRLAIQTSIPSFLGYKNNIAADRTFLLQSINHLEDQQLKEYISEFLRTHNRK